MNIISIAASLGTVGGLGILFGILLAYASKLLAVEKDERITTVEAALPGVNCGTCGYAGCSAYAEAIVLENADLTLCSPGGADCATEIGRIMGREVQVDQTKMVARVHCRGNRSTSQYSYKYDGVTDCNAMQMLFGGDKTCPYGCLGMGSCIKVCPVDAIAYDSEGNVRVNKELCITCGQCISICPTKVMKYVPYDADVLVACNSTDKGGAVKKYCSVGCIGCKICEKQSPGGGFIIENFLASIDYSQKGEREKAALKCPVHCIIKNN